VSGLGCVDADADREVGFAGAGWHEEDHVFGFGEEHPVDQMRDEVPGHRGLVLEVKLLEVLVGREHHALDPFNLTMANPAETNLWADLLAISGQFYWPRAYGQNLLAIDRRTQVSQQGRRPIQFGVSVRGRPGRILSASGIA
jgi:hypothetical protein